jgi:AbrB family looped-hinge helix DNA binding protein
MYAKTVQMTGKGQIVVPKEIRKRLGLEKGSKLIMLQRDDKVTLSKPESLEMLMGFPELNAASEEVLKEVWNDEEDGYWESYL